MKQILRLNHLLLPFSVQAVLAIVLGTVTVLSGVGLMGASAYIIASAALHPSVAVLQVAIVGVRCFGISRGVFRYLERLVSHDVNFALLTRLRIEFFKGLERQTPTGLWDARSGDLLSRVTGDIEVLENYFIRMVYPPVTALMVILSVSVFTGSFDAHLGWVLGIGLLMTCGVVPAVSYWVGRVPARQRSQLRNELQTRLVEDLDGLAELTALNLQPAAFERFSNLEFRLVKAQVRSAVSGGLGAGLHLLGQNLTILIMMLVVIPMIADGSLDGVLLAVFILITQASFEIVTPLGTGAQLLGASLAAGRRLFALMDAPAIDIDPINPAATPRFENLVFRNVFFAYSKTPDSKMILEDFLLDMTAGKRVALVGSSGTGKTTVLRLAQGYLQPHTGEVFLDGNPMTHYQPDVVRQEIAMIAQQTFIFSATIRANLRLARQDAEDRDLLQALERAELGDWFARQHAGLDTWLGGQGGQLSGGERQRFAIARAILRDAKLWCLDEPTAHLDADTEGRVLETLLEASRGRMMLWSTHRLTKMEKMDEILVLQAGKIIERGSHFDLLNSEGYYSRLFWLQKNILSE